MSSIEWRGDGEKLRVEFERAITDVLSCWPLREWEDRIRIDLMKALLPMFGVHWLNGGNGTETVS